MNCKDIPGQINKYLDFELNEEDAFVLRAHLLRCPNCARLYQDFQNLRRLALSAEKVTAPPNFAAIVLRRIDVERVNPLLRLWRRFDDSLARFNRAELGALAVALALFFLIVVQPASRIQVIQQATADIRTAASSVMDFPSLQAENLAQAIRYFGADNEQN